MATNTYVALATYTIPSTVASYTFTSIPQGYTDLILVVNGYGATVDGNVFVCQVGNGSADTGTNYSSTRLSGNGTTASSGRRTSVNRAFLSDNSGFPNSSSQISNYIAQFMNYSNTTTYKTILSRANVASGTYPGTEAAVNLWRSTSAIDTIKVFPDPSENFAAGTTLSLYGIRAEGVSPAPKATGGAIYSDSLYYYHVFGSTGTFTPLQSLTADILCVAGGGGAGVYAAGGGGGGGVITFTSQSLTTTGYTCTVGSGGAKSPSDGSQSSDGVNSSFGALTAAVGGGGGGGRSASPSFAGRNGGSGGGGGGSSGTAGGSSTQTGTGATNFYGNAGGQGGAYLGAGGGGAGAVGSSPASQSANAANGGVGIYSTFINSFGVATGTGELSGGNYYFAGGGCGYTGANNTFALGGGGGANRGTANGTANTGGGGGSNNSDGANGNGGSGIVIVRYAK